jgi:hypothetical protein
MGVYDFVQQASLGYGDSAQVLVPSYCHPFVAFSLGEYFSSGKS